ncbi:MULTISPECIES: helix-turn-helix domain-containing protein [unclassified Serratia (in: enterobacteria)]|uniref:helix-turn-helix domain-containing protein n=1 Tax=unclassified Serratia (in: enterobacteria) TaxID=2647522 RepID=UPI0030761B9D
MRRECFIVTNNSYFFLGISDLISDLPEGGASRLSLDSFLSKRYHNESALLVFYFEDMMSVFKILLFLDGVNNDTVFISKNKNIIKLCSAFGFNSIKIKSIMSVNAVYRKRKSQDECKIKVLSNMERRVMTRLLDGDSNSALARKENLSDKTISHHKRSALVKVGVNNINLFFDDINKDIFSLL